MEDEMVEQIDSFVITTRLSMFGIIIKIFSDFKSCTKWFIIRIIVNIFYSIVDRTAQEEDWQGCESCVEGEDRGWEGKESSVIEIGSLTDGEVAWDGNGSDYDTIDETDCFIFVLFINKWIN